MHKFTASLAPDIIALDSASPSEVKKAAITEKTIIPSQI
jgi:hypothetical protein